MATLNKQGYQAMASHAQHTQRNTNSVLDAL